MQKLDDELINTILKDQLGKLGAGSGAAGGFVGGGLLSSLGGALGGYSGSRWVVALLRTIEYQKCMELPCTPEEAMHSAVSVLASMPSFNRWIHDAPHSTVPFFAAIVGSGFWQMNPTIVCLEVVPADNGNANVHIAAMAKEGLINQHSAEKAVKNIQELLCREGRTHSVRT